MKENIKIAISGKSGCGNTTVSQLVAKELNLKMVNYTFHTMAEERGIGFEEFCAQAEVNPEFDYELDKKQIEIAREGSCVLGSRLAIWLLKNADLKVFLTAKKEVRANRIFQREGGDLDQQIKKTNARDERDHKRFQKLYGIDNSNFNFADLVIDTSNIDQFEVADQIIKKARII